MSSSKENADRLSILHITAPGVVGGLETVVQGLAIGHHGMGHRVAVAAVVDLGQRDHAFLEPLVKANVEVFPIVLPGRAYVRERRLVGEICRRFGPDVVHTHGERPDVLDADVARRLGRPTVTTAHGSSQLGGITRLYEWIQRKVLHRFDAVVAVSDLIAESLRRDGVPADRIHIVPNVGAGNIACLDREAARLALGLPVDGYLVGWVGRLIRVKGCDIFLQALARLRDLPLIVSMVGDGPERSTLEVQASSLGLNGRIKFHGRIDNAALIFSAFDVFVLSSRSEGTPNVLLEAMAANVPIVATSVGGVPDVISDAEGLLVPPEDSIALATAIKTAYSDPHRAQEHAIASRRRLVADFAVGPWLSRYEEIYRQILSRHQQQR